MFTLNTKNTADLWQLEIPPGVAPKTLLHQHQARADIDEFMDDSGGKNGADCRASVMQVQ